jgi:hypothetical protein
VSQLFFSTSNLAANTASSSFSLPGGGFYLMKVRRDPTDAGGINRPTTTTIRQLDLDGVTQIDRGRIQPGDLINGVGYCQFQVDPNGGALTILAGAEGIMWAGICAAEQGSEYF